MKVIILAGGYGTRLSEETSNKPKPMVLIDKYPIIWHIMNIFARQGFQEFVIASGYKGEIIHDWVKKLNTDWKISVLDTGQDTQTGGRIAQCLNYVGNERILATYGDCLGNIDIQKLLETHERENKIATLTGVLPPARFGVLKFEENTVTHFGEKRIEDASWINGGFFVLEPTVLDFIDGMNEPFETGALPRLVANRELSVHLHKDFWQPMDTLHEKNELASLALNDVPPWLNGL